MTGNVKAQIPVFSRNNSWKRLSYLKKLMLLRKQLNHHQIPWSFLFITQQSETFMFSSKELKSYMVVLFAGMKTRFLIAIMILVHINRNKGFQGHISWKQIKRAIVSQPSINILLVLKPSLWLPSTVTLLKPVILAVSHSSSQIILQLNPVMGSVLLGFNDQGT